MRDSEIRVFLGGGDGSGPSITCETEKFMTDAANLALEATGAGVRLRPVVEPLYSGPAYLEMVREGRTLQEIEAVLIETAQRIATTYSGGVVQSFGLGDTERNQGGAWEYRQGQVQQYPLDGTEYTGNFMRHAELFLMHPVGGFRQGSLFNGNAGRRDLFLYHPELALKAPSRGKAFDLHVLTGDHVQIEQEIHGSGAEETVRTKEIHDVNAFEKILRQAALTPTAQTERRLAVVQKKSVFTHIEQHWPEVCQRVQEEMGIKIEFDLVDTFLEKIIADPHSVPTTLVGDYSFGPMLEKLLGVLESGERGPIPDNLKFTILREQKEGKYTFRGGWRENRQEVYQEAEDSYKWISEITKKACQFAKAQGEKSIIVVLDEHHDQLQDYKFQSAKFWHKVTAQIASEEGLGVDFMDQGDLLVKFVSNPESINGRVIVTNNMGGDHLSDAGAALIGRLGMSTAVTSNTDKSASCMTVHATPTGGTAANVAAAGTVNPIAGGHGSVRGLLEYWGYDDAVGIINRAITNVVGIQKIRTPDLNEGNSSMKELAAAINAEVTRLAKAA